MNPVILPRPLPTSVGWDVVDWTEVQVRSDPAAAGVATIEVGQLDADEKWAIHHMVAVCDSTTRTTMRLYRGAPSSFTLLDGSDSGNFDVADWPAPGLLVQAGTGLVAQWVGASTGAIATLTLQVSIQRRRT